MKFIRPVPVTEARLVSSTVPETLPEYDAGTTYAKDDVVRVGTQKYKSAVNDNTGHALTEAGYWLGPAPTNRWAAFDDVNSTVTVADDISFVIQPGELIDSVALLNVSAASVTVVATQNGNEIYSQTVRLSNVVTDSDFYDWFFEPITRSRAFTLVDLPLVANLELTVTLNGEGLSLGTFVMGNVWKLGSTEIGPRIGIRDFSRKENDDFGNQILVVRAFARRGNFTVWCDNEMVDANVDILSEYRATNLVWIGSEQFKSTIIYGWMKTWECEIPYPTQSIFTLEIEGLT